MQNPNLPPGAQPVQGGQPPQKLTREQKRALAEQKKRMEQQRMRAMELQKLVGNLQSELETSVIDPPMMYKLACNRLKLMLKADHAVAAMFETYEQLGEVSIIRQQSNLPPKPAEKKEENKPKVKRVIVDGEVIETVEKVEKKEEDDAPKIPVPKPPPKEPLKAGQLPDLDGVFVGQLSIIDQVRQSRQPLMIPDVSKFSDQAVVTFAAPWSIKSLLLLPSVVNDKVEAIILVMTTTNPQGYAPNEMQFIQRAMEILARSIETAPPTLPEKLKDKVIYPMTHGDNVSKQIEYYSDYFDDIFNFMLGELDAGEEEESEELMALQAEQALSSNKLRKVWYQIGKFLDFKDRPHLSYLFNVAMNELAEQAVEFADSKKVNKPRGLVQFREFMDRRISRPSLANMFLGEEKAEEKKAQHIIVGSEVMSVDTDAGAEEADYSEIFEEIDKEISKAVRGMALFSEGKRATLINDIEQSEMLINFVSVTAAQDFKQHIKANLPLDLHDDIDQHALLADLAHQGMREISLAVAQNMAEKYLYEVETFLEQPEEWQREKIDTLKMYIHYRVMANLVPTLRSEQPSLWGGLIAEKLRKKAAKAAKQRAVLVGRMVRQTSSAADDEDWDDEDEEQDED